MNQYLHCGNCWAILKNGVIISEPNRKFDIYDCGWQCGCGRLNLSSDGVLERCDSVGDKHWLYFRGEEEELSADGVLNGFDFDRDDFKPRS